LTVFKLLLCSDATLFILLYFGDSFMSNSAAFVRDVCKRVGHAHHCCLPQHDMMLSNEYLEDVANEIKKVIFSFSVRCDFSFFMLWNSHAWCFLIRS
jgi:hypothetical protein